MPQEEELRFGGVPASAPLFNKVSPEKLTEIVKWLSDASYHFADDSCGEWGRAKERLEQAAASVNYHRLGYGASKLLYAEKPQLVTFEQFIDAILRSARK